MEEIRSKTDALQTAFHAVSEQMYAQAAQAQASADGANGAADGAPTADAAGSGEEEVVDAEVVDDRER